MSKLLFISPTFPYPPDKGWNVRIYNLVRACAEAFDVTFVAPPAPDATAREKLEEYCSHIIEVHPAAEPVSIQERIRLSLPLFEKIDAKRAQTLSGYESAFAAVDLSDYDLVWVERRDLFSLVRQHAKKIVLDLDDIEHKKLWREVMLRKSLLEKLRGLPRFVGLFLWDALAARNAKVVVVCSEEDKEYLHRMGLDNAVSISNGTNIDLTTAYNMGQADRDLVFLGNMAYTANADAVAYYDREISPLLQTQFPDIKLDVIGNKPADTGNYSKNVRFLGFVEDLASELRHYKAMIVPLRYGGGTKLKVIDGMASGVPLVTSAVGAEGLEISDGRHALLAQSAEDFKNAIEQLLGDPETGARLSANARQLVATKYDWANIRRDTAAWLSRLAENKTGA